MVGVVVVVAMITSNHIISIIIAIIRTAATQEAALGQWLDLPQAAGYQAMPGTAKHCKAIQCNATQWQAMPSNAKQCLAMPSNATQWQALPSSAK